jgi:hypothetical protein
MKSQTLAIESTVKYIRISLNCLKSAVKFVSDVAILNICMLCLEISTKFIEIY